MGETGCGKTSLIEFMAKLQIPDELIGKLETLKIVKVSIFHLYQVYASKILLIQLVN